MSNALTGGFDIIFQLKETSISSLYNIMHREGAIDHHFVDAHHGMRIDLIVNAPNVNLVSSDINDPTLRGITTARVLYFERALDDAADTGTQAVVDVVIRTSLVFPQGDPSPITEYSEISIDWLETKPSDITIYGASQTTEPLIRAAMLDFIRARGSMWFSLSPIKEFGAVALTTWVSSTSSQRLLSIGFSLAQPNGKRSELGNEFIQQEWAIAVSRDYILDRIKEALTTQFGSQLPPPFGQNEIIVSEQEVCVIPDLIFGGCLQTAKQRVILESLTIDLTPQGILLQGQSRQETDVFFNPPVTAIWETTLSFSIGQNNDLIVTASEPSVQIQQWYAVIGNTLTGGLLTTIAKEAVSSALNSSQSGQLLSQFSILFSQFSAIGKELNLKIEAIPTSIEQRTEAIIVHGQIKTISIVNQPVAKFIVIPGNTPQNIILCASESWSPGAVVTDFEWDFGDGQKVSTNGTQARFVMFHNYAVGRYNVCLKIIDSFNRSANFCSYITPGIFEINIPGQQWEFCANASNQPIPLTFEAKSSNAPVSGVQVIAEGQGWQVQGFTTSSGQTTLVLDPQLIEQSGFPATKPNAWCLGAVRIICSKTGYNTLTYILWMMDCIGLARAADEARRHRDGIIDRLAGYAFLKELLDSGAFKKNPLDLNPFERFGVELGIAIDTLTSLTTQLDKQSGILTSQDILNIHASSDIEAAKLIVDRLSYLWDKVKEKCDIMEQQYNESRIPPH